MLDSTLATAPRVGGTGVHIQVWSDKRAGGRGGGGTPTFTKNVYTFTTTLYVYLDRCYLSVIAYYNTDLMQDKFSGGISEGSEMCSCYFYRLQEPSQQVPSQPCPVGCYNSAAWAFYCRLYRPT